MEKAIRLNLGCGTRVLENWINVDLVPRGGRNFQSVKGKTPEVISDIRDLPFDDDYADEIMAIHVVEHFYIWDVPALLKEWIRVLKPGGKMIIEVPDLEKIILYMSVGETHPSFTMWPLYGDPSEKDPLMVHKWAYTAKSLEKMMNHIGLNGINREPAQFHFKEERDLRMVGYK